MRFGVLGPLIAEDPRGPVELKGPRHRAVLARLLVARGRVVPLEQLVDDLWAGAAPPGAVGAVQTFVSALRRALEPHRAPRAPAALLVTSGRGYALRAAPDAVDAWRFEQAVGAAREVPAGERSTLLDSALGEWRGPAYAEFADLAWARGAAARLDELRSLALERRAEAMLALGRAAEVVADLEAQVDADPGRERAWGLFALALYRTGRQRDALAALRRARRVLAEDVGLDPGPDLRKLEADILAQAPSLLATDPPGASANPAAPVLPASAPAGGLVGRQKESARLAGAAADARERGALRLVLVSGEAGAGKTALVTALAERLAGDGWLTAWGANPDDRGLPAGWPWHQILVTLAAHVPDPPAAPGPGGDPGVRLAPGHDPAAARFRWQRAVGGYLATVAGRAPLLLVVDDLHWAGAETLALLASVVTEPPDGPVLVVATHRSTDIPPILTDTLGRVARAEPTRLHLGGLAALEVPALVRSVTGRDVDTATAATIHRRTGGNPFFVRELARLLAARGEDGSRDADVVAAVPPGVRDVVRQRVAALPEPVRTILRRAAVLGPELDTTLQTALTGDEDAVLDAVELSTARGFLVERGPRRFPFAHALVRDALASEVSGARRAGWHASAAAALERLRPDDVEALAEHYLLADDPGTASRAAHYARAAAERAERRAAPSEALRYWTAALRAFDRARPAARSAPASSPAPAPASEAPANGAPASAAPASSTRASGAPASEADRGDVRTRLDLIMGVVRAQAVTGELAAARQRRTEALALAGSLGDPLVTAQVIGAFDTPAIWPDADDPVLARHIADVTERTLAALPADRTAERSRLLATLALELRSAGGERAVAAAREAEALARALDDPAVLAFALNARFLQSFSRAGLAPERARIGAELVTLAHRAELRTFEILGHLILLQARSALADFTAADAHAEAADALGERYQSPLVTVFTDWYRAMRASVTGRSAEAGARYWAAARHLAGTEMVGMHQGVAPLALFCAALRDGGSPVPFAADDFGAFEPWVRPLVTDGPPPGSGEASRVAAEVPESPRDLLYEARTCLHALVAVRAGDRELMARLHATLLPARDELAGAGSGLLTLAPVAHYLGELATALHRPDDAAAHRRDAARVLARCR